MVRWIVTDPKGTAYKTLHDFPFYQGSGQNRNCRDWFEDRSSSNGLFICYAPADNPQVAIAQVVEKGARWDRIPFLLPVTCSRPIFSWFSTQW